MDNIKYTSAVICLYGFFKTFRPSEPYDVKYLIEYKNFTQESIVQDAYPVASYTWFSTLPIVFLLAGVLRYRLFIHLEALSILSLIAIMIWGEGIIALKAVEFFYGMSVSCEIAYYTYIYVKIDKQHFRKVTSLVYSATFCGNFGSAIIAQLFVSFHVMNLHDLHYLSLGGSSLACLLTLFLPAVKLDTAQNEGSLLHRAKLACEVLRKDFKASYWNFHVLRWSIWWAVEKAGNYQVVTYSKSLLQEIDSTADENHLYNGAVQAIQCILSVTLSIGIAHLPIQWNRHGQYLLVGVALLQGFSLFGMANMSSLLPAYALLVFYRTLHQVTVTITSAEIAQNISSTSQGLVFGFNVFLAAGLQVLITVAISSKAGFALNIRHQFVVYAACNVLLGLLFAILSACACFCKSNGKSNVASTPGAYEL